MNLYCCGCRADTQPELVTGAVVYPHRQDLAALPFWRCTACRNYVGCHHRTKDRTKPLGCIPTKALRAARQDLHALVDPLWRSKRMTRRKVYAAIETALGKPFHTADMRTLADVWKVVKIVKGLRAALLAQKNDNGGE